MKHPKLIYSRFVPNRPEYTSLLELWCMLGGFIVFIYISFDSEVGFAGKIRLETMLSLIFPAVFFFIGYLARHIKWMRSILILAVLISLGFSSYLYFFPAVEHLHLPSSDIALMIFTFISLLIVVRKNSDTSYENI